MSSRLELVKCHQGSDCFSEIIFQDFSSYRDQLSHPPLPHSLPPHSALFFSTAVTSIDPDCFNVYSDIWWAVYAYKLSIKHNYGKCITAFPSYMTPQLTNPLCRHPKTFCIPAVCPVCICWHPPELEVFHPLTLLLITVIRWQHTFETVYHCSFLLFN